MIMEELHWSAQIAYPVLGMLQLVPLLAAVLMLFWGTRKGLFPLAILLVLLECLLAFELYRHFDSSQSVLQFAEQWTLLSPLIYHAAVDGISVLFILLAAILTLMLVLYVRIRRLRSAARFMAIIFAVQSALMGSFATQNLLWFALFSTLAVMLVGYLLRWANAPQEELARQRYMQFMGISLLLLFTGVIMLGWNYADLNQGQWSFELAALAATPVPASLQSVIFFLLFYGLAIRVPLFPLHGWLPLIAEHGTVAVAGVFLLGLKTGIYGLIRFVFPLLPDAVLRWQVYVVAFAVVGIFYAALLALMQNNLRRLLAFAVVSHTSVLVIGLFTLTHDAFMGAVMLSVNFGLASACLLFVSGMVFRRTRTLRLDQLGGLFDRLPLIGAAFLIAGLSIIGMPGTPGFDAVHLVLAAEIIEFGALLTIAAALGNVAAAAFLLWAFQRAFLAPADAAFAAREIEKATSLERVLVGGMLLVLLVAGFHSQPWLSLIDLSLEPLGVLYGHE